MIRLSKQSLITLTPILQLCSNNEIFISSTGAFSASNNDGKSIYEGKVAQKFPENGNYLSCLCDKHGNVDCEQSELRYLQKSSRHVATRISKVVECAERESIKKSHFLMNNFLCSMLAKHKMKLGNAGIVLMHTSADLYCSVELNDASRFTGFEDEIFIHEFDGEPCEFFISGTLPLFREITLQSNEEFFATLLHAGVLILESTLRDLTIAKTVCVNH